MVELVVLSKKKATKGKYRFCNLFMDATPFLTLFLFNDHVNDPQHHVQDDHDHAAHVHLRVHGHVRWVIQHDHVRVYVHAYVRGHDHVYAHENGLYRHAYDHVHACENVYVRANAYVHVRLAFHTSFFCINLNGYL
jgi:hypothetical protein